MKRKRRQRRILTFSVVALLLQLAFPPGYMPGNALAGQAVSLCPIGLPEGFFSTHHHHHHHHDHSDDAGEWNAAAESCIFSSSLSPEPLVTPLVVSAAPAAQRTQHLRRATIAARHTRHFPRYYSRAPPVHFV